MHSRVAWILCLVSLWATVKASPFEEQVENIHEQGTIEQETVLTCHGDDPFCIIDAKLVGVDSHAEDLVMNDMGIEKIKPQVFEDCTDTKSLVMSNNKLTSLTPEMLSGLSNVTFMNFFNNSIKEIENKTFAALPNLKELELSYNKLYHLTDNVRNDLSQLLKLHLNSQPFQLKKDGFFGLKNLELLELTGDKIQSIVPGSLNHLGNLKRLDLSNNELSSIHSSGLKGLNSLIELDLSNNLLGWLNHKTFEGLENLKHLWLTGNRLNAIITDTIFKDISKLQTLYLHNNPLQFVNFEIFSGMNDIIIEPGFKIGSTDVVYEKDFSKAPITWCIIEGTTKYYEPYHCKFE